MCDWCDACNGAGEFTYIGWVIALPGAGIWRIFPWRDGLGGAPIDLDDSDIPAAWTEIAAPLAAQIEIVADDHADPENQLTGAVVYTGNAVEAHPATRVQLAGDAWQFRAADATHLVTVPAALTTRRAQFLQRARLWWWPGAASEPTWQFEDAWGFLNEHDPDLNPGIAVEQWRNRRRGYLSAMGSWVNPYNFVPLGSGPDKGEPEFHSGLAGGRVSGRVSVCWTARTPLALSGAGTGSIDDPHRPVELHGGGFVPGSQIAGVVRSFHEALTDSCLRVVDRDFVPVHRDVAQVPSGLVRMAVVRSGGVAVQLCDPVPHDGHNYPAVWVEARDLAPSLNSGMEFHVDLAAMTLTVPRDRFRVERVAGPVPTICTDPAGTCRRVHWRTIVTSAMPDRKRDPQGDHHPHHLPFAPLTGDVHDLPAGALATYRQAAEDSRDVVVRRRGGPPHLAVPNIGSRQEVTAELAAGQVVWAQFGAAGIERVTPSVLWRAPGAGAVRERLAGYGPCTDPTSLCPSCRLFGMVEERDRPETGEPARVSAYRGHVRFGHAVLSAIDDDATHLREMGTPRPGAGQFYLENGDWAGQQATSTPQRPQRPLREWGSPADQPSNRLIRGRKFYWANGTADQAAATGDRYRAAAGAHATMSSRHRLSPVGATLTFTVHFDNVTTDQLGALLVSVDPNLLRRPAVGSLLIATRRPAVADALEHELGLHLGKGKGVGLGTVSTRLNTSTADSRDAQDGASATTDDASIDVEIWDAARYLTGPADGSATQPVEPTEALRCVEQFVRRAVESDHAEGWDALLAMSAIDAVPSDRITYPPDDHPGRDFTFDFWKRSTGASGTVKGKPPMLVTLPRPDDQDVTVHRPWLTGGGA